MGFITANRGQLSLLGYSIDDFVEEAAKCRFVAELVNELDLKDLYSDYSSQGGDAFDPAIMLATWFFAYSEGISSTRRLEQLCRRDMHYIYISGNLHPDHTSLSRFRKRHIGIISRYFIQLIRISLSKGVSDFKRISIDGSKFQAASSGRQSCDEKFLAKDLESVREEIREYLERSELLDEEDDCSNDLNQVRRKLDSLKAHEQKLKERKDQLKKRKEGLQNKDKARHKINKVEPDARNMKMADGRRDISAYNCQISVDIKSGLIVSTDVTDEPTDQKQFSKQHKQVEANLGNDGDREYTADAGYHSLEQLEYVEEKKVDAVIAEPRPEDRSVGECIIAKGNSSDGKPFKRGLFRYDSATDEYRCPGGRQLRYWYTERKRGHRVRVYRERGILCSGCALRSRCLRSNKPKSYRRIFRDEQEWLAEAMLMKSSCYEGRQRMRERAMSVEPVFGNIKANMGLSRFCLRDMSNVQGEFNLMSIGHNINKLYRLLRFVFRHIFDSDGENGWILAQMLFVYHDISLQRGKYISEHI